jgi:hypothetical protein
LEVGRWTFVLILLLLLPLIARAASTTQPAIYIRDCTALTDASAPVANGGSLYLSQLPAKWTLDYDFGLAAGHTCQTIFAVDGGKPVQLWTPPYSPAGHNIPLALSTGTHTITLTVNGAAIAPLTFTLGTAPPILPTGQIAQPFTLIINAGGISDPAINLATHPLYLPFFKSAGVTGLRVWTEGAFAAPQPASYYAALLPWQKAGVHVIAVANFQNSVPRLSAPTDAVWTAWLTAIPPPATTGIWAIEIGNEVNTGDYYNGSGQQLAHLMQLAYPILHAKGYVVIAPSTLNSLNEIQTLVGLGAYQWADYLNIHSYRGTPAAIAADADAASPIAASVGKPLAMTEEGLRLGNVPAAVLASQQVQTTGLLSQRSVLAGYFPLYLMASDTLDIAAPFTATGAINQPFYGAMGGK